jgi:hypothetical protein
VDPRAGLDDTDKQTFFILPGLKIQPLACPACRQLLYQLCYHGSFRVMYISKKKVKLSLCLSTTPQRYMGGLDVQIHVFLILALVEGVWSAQILALATLPVSKETSAPTG